MCTLTKILSGGQTGVDQAALRAALAVGLPMDGHAPPERTCEDGSIPAAFPLRPTPHDRSPWAPELPRSQRTEWNVRDADATLVLTRGPLRDPGTAFTIRCAERLGRPWLVCDPTAPAAAARILAWISTHAIRTLNVAGPSERTAPNIGAETEALLVRVFASARAEP